MDITNGSVYWRIFPFHVVCHDATFVGWFIGIEISPSKRFWRRTSYHLLSIKPSSLKDLTSSYERLVPSYRGQIEKTISQLTTYLHFVPPPRHAMIHVIYTKPELLKLEGNTYELKGQTKISKAKKTNGIKLGNYPYGTIMLTGFLQCWTLDMRCRGTSFYMSHFIFAWSF